MLSSCFWSEDDCFKYFLVIFLTISHFGEFARWFSPQLASGELALDSCSCQAAGIMNSYLLAVSGVTYTLYACNQSEFDVMMIVVMVVKKFLLLRAASSPH